MEEVTEWDAKRGYHRVRMSEMASMPLNESYADIAIEPLAKGRSRVRWGMDYRVKYVPIGWLMGQTMMKMMGPILDGNLKGLADKVRSSQKATA